MEDVITTNDRSSTHDMNTTGQTPDRPQAPPDARVCGDSGGHGAKTAAVKERAILALLTGKSVSAAAKQSGVHERTLRRWLAEDEGFKRDLAQAQREAFQAGMQRVQALTGVAVDTLAALMAKGVPPAVRLGAARTVAELAMHEHDAETILKKLDEIEAFQREHGTTSRR